SFPEIIRYVGAARNRCLPRCQRVNTAATLQHRPLLPSIMHTVSRILAATDFSAAGHAAVARAGQIAGQHAAELRVIHATPDWNLFSNRAPMPQQHYEDISKNAQLLLRRTTDWLASEFSIRVLGAVHRGKASQTITRAIAMYQPNLLVIGAHGEH